MATATAAELATLVTGTLNSGMAPEYTTFQGLLDGYIAASTMTSDAISTALIPNDSVLTGNDTVNYLMSRPAFLKNFFDLHLSNTNTILPGTNDGSTVTQFTAATYVPLVGSNVVVSAGTVLPAVESQGIPTMVGNPGFITSSTSDGDASYATYDTGLLYDDALNDGFALAQVANDLGTAITADAFSALSADIVLDLINLHAVDSLVDTANKWYTIFVPVDTATVLATSGLGDFLTWNRAQAQTVLLNHVIQETMGVYSEDVVAAGASTFDTLGMNGDVNTITTDATASSTVLTFADPDATNVAITVNAAMADYYVMGAVVHAVDQVAITAAQTLAITDAIAMVNLTDAAPPADFATLNALIADASETTLLYINDVTTANEEHKTLLAPTEDAFSDLAQYKKDYLMDPANVADLDIVLKAHVLTEPVWTDMAFTGTDGNGAAVTCATANSAYMCGAATLTSRVDSLNGVSYSIDTVIIPASVEIPEPETSSSSESGSSSDSSASSLAISGVAMAACAAVLALF